MPRARSWPALWQRLSGRRRWLIRLKAWVHCRREWRHWTGTQVRSPPPSGPRPSRIRWVALKGTRSLRSECGLCLDGIITGYGSPPCLQTWKRTPGPFPPPSAPSSRTWSCRNATVMQLKPSLWPTGCEGPQHTPRLLDRLAADGEAMATIEQARAAISYAHAAAGMAKADNPARHPVVAEGMKGWRNQASSAKQADALTADARARIQETARLPRRDRSGHMESPPWRRPGVPSTCQSLGRWPMAISGGRRLPP